MIGRKEFNFNLFLLALISTFTTISVFAQDQNAINAKAYATVQKCGQREYVDPSFCSLQNPPINCVLPQFCYTATGQETDLKCQQLPDACFQQVLQAQGGGGVAFNASTTPSASESTSAPSLASATNINTTLTTTTATISTTATTSTTTGATSAPGTTISTTTRPPTAGGFPTQTPAPPPRPAPGPSPVPGPVLTMPKNLIIISDYDSELGPPSIPTNFGGNFQQKPINPQQNFQVFPQPPPPFQSQQSKGFQRQQPVVFQQTQYKGFQQAPVPPQPQFFQPPPQLQFQSKGFQGGFQQRSLCSDNYGTCSFMANPVQCGQAGSWMWQNCPFACGRC